MTTKEFIALEKSLLPQLPSFVIQGKLMLLPPIKHILRGVNFDSSGFNKTTFYVSVFITPLFVPAKYLTLSYGDRVRKREGADRWHDDMPNLIEELSAALKKQAIPFLTPVQSLHDFVSLTKQTLAKYPNANNPHTPKDMAFALALAGETQEAIKIIDDLIPRLDTKSAWQVELGEMASSLKEKLIHDPAEARRQLETWEAETTKNLGLTGL